MKEPDNWRKAGVVPGGKGHLLASYVLGGGPLSDHVKAHTACGRVAWVRLVAWHDWRWDGSTGPGWACLTCQRVVRALLAAEPRPADDPDRAERLRLYVALQAIARQAAQPGPVLESRAQLIAERDQAREARRAMDDELRDRRRALSNMGSRVHRDGKELDRLNELLGEYRLENNRLRADNRHLARMAAKAELLRDMVTSLFPPEERRSG